MCNVYWKPIIDTLTKKIYSVFFPYILKMIFRFFFKLKPVSNLVLFELCGQAPYIFVNIWFFFFGRYHPSFNVSPGSYLPVVRKEDNVGKGAVIHCMKWGLIPSFTKKTEKPDHFRMVLNKFYFLFSS